jgi:hypothetical protein
LFAYNEKPDALNEPTKYPSTPLPNLLKAMDELYSDQLSFGKGESDGLQFDLVSVFFTKFQVIVVLLGVDYSPMMGSLSV